MALIYLSVFSFGNECDFSVIKVCEADFALWIEGIKRLEMNADAAGYEKLVRQRAAVCLREKRGGGTIVSCALMADYLNEGGIDDED